jgi:hypothetical protein
VENKENIGPVTRSKSYLTTSHAQVASSEIKSEFENNSAETI